MNICRTKFSFTDLINFPACYSTSFQLPQLLAGGQCIQWQFFVNLVLPNSEGCPLLHFDLFLKISASNRHLIGTSSSIRTSSWRVLTTLEYSQGCCIGVLLVWSENRYVACHYFSPKYTSFCPYWQTDSFLWTLLQ